MLSNALVLRIWEQIVLSVEDNAMKKEENYRVFDEMTSSNTSV